MKIRALFLVLLSGTILALAIVAIPIQSASAKTCYNLKKQIVPCPNQQAKPTATDVPATPTDTPKPNDTPTNTPDAGQLALMCTSAGFIPNTGNPGQGNSNPSAPGGNVPQNAGLLGGVSLLGILIGLIVGVLIGLLLPAVQKGFGGIVTPPDSHGGIISPTDNPTGIISPTDNPAGIISPTDSHGVSNVNGDYPPGPPQSPDASNVNESILKDMAKPGDDTDAIRRVKPDFYDEQLDPGKWASP